MSELMTVFVRMPKRYAKALLGQGLSFINDHPKLHRYVLVIIRRLGLIPVARAIYAKLSPTSRRSDMSAPYGFIPTEIAHLPPRARLIYADLKAAIERRQKESG